MEKVKLVQEVSDIPVKLLRLLCYQQLLSFLFYSRARQPPAPSLSRESWYLPASSHDRWPVSDNSTYLDR